MFTLALVPFVVHFHYFVNIFWIYQWQNLKQLQLLKVVYFLRLLFHHLYYIKQVSLDMLQLVRFPLSILTPSGLYSAATSSQDLLYFGAILSFHSHFSKANSSKISMLVIYIFFSVGVMLAAFFNIGVVPVALNYIGLFAVLIGVIGIYLSFLIRLYEHVSHLWSLYQCVEPNSILNQHTIHNIRDNLYLYILIMNLTFRLLLFQLISPGDADSRAIHGQPYYIMFNTISVVFLSIINSRQLKMKYFQIQHRFETKRNFVRYISQYDIHLFYSYYLLVR